MSIKTGYALKNLKQIGDSVEESEQFIGVTLDSEREFIPPIDYATASNFARFGLAEEYYKESVERIYKTFPYDGSKTEQKKWYQESDNLCKFIYDNLYPRTNGYASLGNSWGTQAFILNGYGAPNSSSYEYIQTKGGPNLGFDLSGDRFTKQIKKRYENSNKYDQTKKRKTNLEFDVVNDFSGSDAGVSVEFWLKKNGFGDASTTQKEVLFDLWNGHSTTNSSYGRLIIETNATASNGVFRITCQSGSNGFKYEEIGAGASTTVAGIGNNQWKHLCFTFFINDSGDLQSNLYVNGTLNDKKTISETFGLVTGSLTANIGALRTSVYGAVGSIQGHGKVISASFDDFRFWKVRRTEEEIRKQYNDYIGGGSNNDDSSTKLGIYYKFNEGITLTSSVDSMVLDYSGRVSNGVWTGYAQSLTPRYTGSAIVESSASNSEFLDPIVYSFHPDVVSLKENLINSGSEHDYKNQHSLWRMFPNWITEDDLNIGTGELRKLTQTLAHVLDNLFIKIDYLKKNKWLEYYNSKSTSNSFFPQIIQSLGLELPELFKDADEMNYFLNRNDKTKFEYSIQQIKNIIYRNIYNNINYVLKSKGTEASYRNLLRCFGIDSNLVKFNMYSNGEEFETRDSFEISSQPKNVVNFYDADNFSSVIYQMSSSADTTNTVSYITASDVPSRNDFIPFAMEGEIIFPNIGTPSEQNHLVIPFISSSLFGVANAIDGGTFDTTWASPSTASLNVFAIKERQESKDVKFVLSGSVGGLFPVLTSSIYPDVYNNEKWNISVNVKHAKHPFSNLVSGSSLSGEGGYLIEFYGVSPVLDLIPSVGSRKREFFLTSSLTNEQGVNFLRSNKRLYGGALRTNVTGALLNYSDVLLSNLRVWSNYLPTSSVLAHAQYANNHGIVNFYQHFLPFNTSITQQQIPSIDSLVLDWNFSTNTGSDSGGQFFIYDESSGSVSAQTLKYGWLGSRLKQNHPGRGDFFVTSSTGCIKQIFTTNLVRKLPESINSVDSVNIKATDVEFFTKDSRPIKTIFSFEKNPYQNISEDMLNWFSNMSDFDTIVGHPVEKYREKYKKLSNLRNLYFYGIEEEPNIDRFFEFYKWVDESILEILMQLIPASSKTTNAWNVVESHIFERNKFQHKFPLLETKVATTGSITGIGELLYSWAKNHAPIGLNQENNGEWWKNQASKDLNLWGSLPTDVKNNRKSLSSINETSLQQKRKAIGIISSDDITIDGGKARKEDVENNFTLINQLRDFGGGNSLFGNKKTIVISGSDIIEPRTKENTKLPDKDNILFTKRENTYKYGITSMDGQISGSGKDFLPFRFVSSSVKQGYNKVVTDATSKNIQIVDIHHDSYTKDSVIQGIFTKTHVGGYVHRHHPMNTGSDNVENRPELFKILAISNDLYVVPSDYESNQNPSSRWSRDNLVKSYINVKNIGNTDKILGNYSKNYQVVNKTGRLGGDSVTKKGNGISLTKTQSTFVTGLNDFSILRRDLTGSKSIFVNKFSAPGGAETTTEAINNLESNEFSPYNALPWRNLTQRTFLDQLWASGSHAFGVITPSNPSSASYHKVYRNNTYRLETSGQTTVTSSQNDNMFVQRPIPRSDLQYSWVRKTAVQANNLLIANKETNIPFQYGTPSKKDGKIQEILYVSASNFGSYRNTSDNGRYYGTTFETNLNDFIPDSFVWLNTNLYEPITSSQNLLGYSHIDVTNPDGGSWARVRHNFINSFVISGDSDENVDDDYAAGKPGLVTIFNSLMNKRNGPYGYPSWKQVRTNEHAVIRHQVKNNIISIVEPLQEQNVGAVERFMPRRHFAFSQFFEAPVSKTSLPVRARIFYNNENSIFEFSHNNKKEQYGQNEINSRLQIVGGLRVQEMPYNMVKRIYLGSGSISASLTSLSYRQNIFPHTKNFGLNKTRTRPFFEETGGLGQNGFDRRPDVNKTFWPPSLQRTNVDGATPFQNAVSYRWGRNVYPIGNEFIHYADVEIPSLVGYQYFYYQNQQKVREYSGELCPAFATSSNRIGFNNANIQGMFGVGQSWHSGSANNSGSLPDFYYLNPTASLQFAYLADLGKNSEVAWPNDVHRQAGRGAFYNSYNEFAQDIKPISLGYSLLPEFKISDYIEKFYVDGLNSLTELKDFLKLPGSYLSQSANDYSGSYEKQFFENYTNSEVVKNFDQILEEHEKNGHKLQQIKIKCKALKKLLPYNGFYPINRTVQLGAYFSQSVVPYISGNFDSVQASASLKLQALLQPMFAPGIVFNTIKSGIAVDWPIFTSSYQGALDLYKVIKNDSGVTAIYDPFIIHLSASGQESPISEQNWREYFLSSSHGIGSDAYGKFHWRIPFTSLFNLNNGFPSGVNVPMMCPDKIYQLSSSNDTRYPYFHWNGKRNSKFELAANNFFGEIPKFFLQNQTLTSFESDIEKNFKPLQRNVTYFMDVSLYKTDDLFMVKSYFSGNLASGSDPGSGFNDTWYSYNGQYFGPPMLAGNLSSYFSDNRLDTRAIHYSDPAYAPFTPPYFYTKAKARLSFTAKETRKYSIDEILSNVIASASYTNFFDIKTATLAEFPASQQAQANAMRIDASVDLFRKSNTTQSADSTGFDKWRISTKFECPVLNFSNSLGSTDIENWPTTSSQNASIGKGIWGTYGYIPTSSTGIYLEIEDSHPNQIYRLSSDDINTGSLIDVCGFKQSRQKIGVIADGKIIQEAVVAIPYVVSSQRTENMTQIGGRNFFKIEKKVYETIKKNVDSGDAAIKIGQFNKTEDVWENSISNMIKKMKNYYFPPFMDFSIHKEVEPFVAYIFEFDEFLDKQDLSDIWQGVMAKPTMKVSKQDVEISHRLDPLEFFHNQKIPKDIQWMVFKVKKRAERSYSSIVGDGDRNVPIYNYNWPYDYFSLVEMANLSVDFTIM